MSRKKLRNDVLKALGASISQKAALLAYNNNVFDHSHVDTGAEFPLKDEPFVATWESYEHEA